MTLVPATSRRVTFVTSCWEKEWKQVLLSPDYLKNFLIGNHCHAFAERILVIVNVENLTPVLKAAEKRISEGLIDRVVLFQEDALKTFGLQRADFRGSGQFSSDFIYYNAMGPLMGIHSATCEYIFYQRADVRVEKPTVWIGPAIDLMEKNPAYKIANLVWNYAGTSYYAYREAEDESFTKDGDFYVSNMNFSDQMFLAKLSDLNAPIYSEPRADIYFHPGDSFEMRVVSAMKNRGWLRLIHAHGAYIHQNP